jgi:hypothetical protein
MAMSIMTVGPMVEKLTFEDIETPEKELENESLVALAIDQRALAWMLSLFRYQQAFQNLAKESSRKVIESQDVGGSWKRYIRDQDMYSINLYTEEPKARPLPTAPSLFPLLVLVEAYIWQPLQYPEPHLRNCVSEHSPRSSLF